MIKILTLFFPPPPPQPPPPRSPHSQAAPSGQIHPAQGRHGPTSSFRTNSLAEGVSEGVTEVIDVPVKSIASNRDFVEKFGVKFGVKGDRLHRMVLIILSLYENKSIDLPKLAVRFGISKRMIEKDISFLRRKELIVFQGAPKTGRYVLTEKGKNMLSDTSKL